MHIDPRTPPPAADRGSTTTRTLLAVLAGLVLLLAGCRTGPGNSDPAARNDTYSTDADTALTVDAAAGVLANDDDPDGDTLTATLTSDVGDGTLTLNTDGSFSYVPNAGFVGQDTFEYEADDGEGGTATATVTVRVGLENEEPAISGTPSFETFGNTVLVVTSADPAGTLLDGASDVDGDTLEVVAETVTTSDGGTAEIAADGTFVFTPAPGSGGTDSFEYKVSDGTATVTGTAEVAITGMVWYVDNGAAPGGTGLSDAPFQTIADAVAEASSGEIVHVATGDSSYEAGVTLGSGVSLLGEGVDLIVDATTLIAAGTAPVIDADASGAGAAVTVESDTVVRGFEFDGSGGNDVHGVYAPNLASPQTNLEISDNTFTGFSFRTAERPVLLSEVAGAQLDENVFTDVPDDLSGDGALVELRNVTGTVLFTDNAFTGTVGADLVNVTADDTAPLDLTIDRNAFSPTLHAAGRYGVFVSGNETDAVTVDVTDNTFSDVAFQALRLDVNGAGAATMAATVTGNTFDTTYNGVVLDADQDHVLTALVQNNVFTDSRNVSILADIDDAEPAGATTLDVSILSNTFTNVGTPLFADAIGVSITNPAASAQTLRVNVENNAVSGVAGAGFSAFATGAAPSNSLSVTLLNNAFLLTNDNSGSDSVALSSEGSATLCVDADGNEATDSLGDPGNYALAQAGSSVLQAEEAADASTFAALQTSGTASYSGTIAGVAAGTCTPPALP